MDRASSSSGERVPAPTATRSNSSSRVTNDNDNVAPHQSGAVQGDWKLGPGDKGGTVSEMSASVSYTAKSAVELVRSMQKSAELHEVKVDPEKVTDDSSPDARPGSVQGQAQQPAPQGPPLPPRVRNAIETAIINRVAPVVTLFDGKCYGGLTVGVVCGGAVGLIVFFLAPKLSLGARLAIIVGGMVGGTGIGAGIGLALRESTPT